VIVRISGEGQYDLSDDLHHRLNELDDAAVAAVDRGDEDGWHAAFEELLQFVRANGTEIGDDDLRGSEIILPPADTSFAEAGEDFTGEGLVPDPA
jgi:choline dehydrogenase-like flavoprotein